MFFSKALVAAALSATVLALQDRDGERNETANQAPKSVLVGGQWITVQSDPSRFTNDVTIGSTIAWLPCPILTYNDLFCPFQDGINPNTVALKPTDVIPLPQLQDPTSGVYIQDGVMTFSTKNWGQIINFRCVNGTGDIDYGGFNEQCDFNVFIPSSCHSFVIDVGPGSQTTKGSTKATSEPYIVNVLQAVVNATVAVMNPTAGPVDIEFNAVTYNPLSTGIVQATIFFTAIPFRHGDILKATPVVDATYTIGGPDAKAGPVQIDVGSIYNFKVVFTLNCGITSGQQITIDAAACKQDGGGCGPISSKGLVFTADTIQQCVFTSSFTPDMTVFVVPPIVLDAAHIDPATGSYFFKLHDSVYIVMWSHYYLVGTKYGYQISKFAVNGHTISRNCLTYGATNFQQSGVMVVKMALNDATGNPGSVTAPRYQDCASPGDLAFVDGSNKTFYTVSIYFDVASGPQQFDPVAIADLTILQTFYQSVNFARRDQSSIPQTNKVAVGVKVDIRGLKSSATKIAVAYLLSIFIIIF
ncbi:hypothetical protein BC830DRAFT_1165855 [Chytriomyces sp. MP71]|nr:hypothetical protein BC830DRAFT_1165855 [Chytriomyces sp. MP71]